MSIIAAVRKNGQTVIGADTMSTWGDGSLRLAADHIANASKLIYHRGVWIGLCASLRAACEFNSGCGGALEIHYAGDQPR